MIDRRPIIGVMGSHEKEWAELAEPVGRLIADFGYHLLTGAGAGVMTAVARAFTESEDREGISIGIVPTIAYEGGFVPREKYPNPYVELPVLTPLDKKAQGDISPFSRNYVNIMTSSAVIILPGEHGTQNEAGLALQYKKPAILFGPEEAFARFPERPMRLQEIEELKEFLGQVREKFRSDEQG